MRATWVPIVALLLGLPATPAQDAVEAPPKDLGLVERSGARLAQIDITVIGPPEVVADLTPQDFSIRVQFKPIREFVLDRYCDAPPAPAGPVDDAGKPGTIRVAAARAPSSYLFFMDQIHLTLSGRQSAISLARQLVRELIHDGNRGMLVSNANELLVAQALTDDPRALLDALERLENDRTQWHEFASQEDARVNDVVETMNSDNVYGAEQAMGRARRYQMEETWRAEKSMRRLAMTLARVTDVPAPKAVFYFADTMRQNAGEHYLSFFGERLLRTRAPLQQIGADSLAAQNPFDRIVNEAAAQGIRFYPVLSQGMVGEATGALPSASAQNQALAGHGGSRARYYHARDTLSNLAAETGGYAFVAGQGAGRMAERVDEDFTCLYIASFDPAGFDEDHALRILVESKREGVEVRSRGRIVVQSESARRTSRLLSAFAGPESGADDLIEVRTQVVPTGFRDGGFVTLLQISVPPAPMQGAVWDLGASVVTRDKVDFEAAGRLSVPVPGLPVVFETEMTLRPGSHEVIAVAHESTTGLISSGRALLAWPDPRKERAMASPVAVLQPTAGAFLRDEEVRKSGSLARGENEPVLTDRPIALISLVCRGRKNQEPLRVERSLTGESRVDFPPLTPEFGPDACTQIRDLVPAGTLGEGYYRYEVVVLGAGEALHSSSRELLALDPSGS